MVQSVNESTDSRNKTDWINVNCLLVGDAGVGKTSILNRYVKKKFD